MLPSLRDVTFDHRGAPTWHRSPPIHPRLEALFPVSSRNSRLVQISGLRVLRAPIASLVVRAHHASHLRHPTVLSNDEFVHAPRSYLDANPRARRLSGQVNYRSAASTTCSTFAHVRWLAADQEVLARRRKE